MNLMLVLSRKKGQSIIIGNDIEISVIDIQGEQVRLGINAPGNVKVYRKEVYDEIIRENREASIIPVSPEQIKGIRITMNGKPEDKEKN
mgnify:CR=1 FL=1